MLVLTRQPEESVDLYDQHGNLIGTVTILDVRNSGRNPSVRMGFRFRDDIKIMRSELEVDEVVNE